MDTNVKRGDIFYADLSPVVGSEQGGTRPVLIVQNDTGNRHSPTVIAAAITSSSPTDRIRAHLGFLGLYHRFARICSGHEVPRGKPAPDIYLHGAASLGLPPEECLALEDAPTGIRSAYDAGCLTAMIPDQDQPSAETTALLYAKADSLADIIGLLETIHAT